MASLHMTTRDDIALYHHAFRTLSLASPTAFMDSALVLGALDAVKSVVEEPKGLPLTF